MKKFSVVLPAYNVENYIEKALQCLLQQTTDDFEVIVVDDCATDATGELVDAYQDAFAEKKISYTVIHKPENQGLSMARNTGMDQATGEYILFWDTDDVYEKTALEMIKSAMRERKPDMLVYGYTEDYYKNENMSYRVEKMPKSHYFSGQTGNLPLAYRYITDLEQQTMFGYAWNKAYRLGFLREQKLRFETITHIEDVLFNMEVAKHMQSMQTVPYMLYHYCNRGQARLTAKYLPQYFALQKQRFETFLSLQEEKMMQCRQGAGEQCEEQLELADIEEWEQKVKETMAGAYFRAFQSFMVREITHRTPKRQILQQANAEMESELYQKLRTSLAREGKVAKVLYQPLADGKMKTAYARAKLICFVQTHFPGVFAKLKQNR